MTTEGEGPEPPATNPWVQPRSRQQFFKFNVDRVMRRIVKENPDMTDDEHIWELNKECYAQLHRRKSNRDPINACIDFAGSAVLQNIARQAKRQKPRGERAIQSKTKPEHVRRVVEEISTRVLLQTILPNGKSLYDSTREEIIDSRTGLANLIAKLNQGETPRMAGLTDKDLE